MDWGFQEDEIKLVCDTEGFQNADFNEAEYQEIDTIGRVNKTLLFLFFKGHTSVKGDLIHGVSGQDESQCIEGFLRKAALLPNVYVVAVFDSCRRYRSDGDPAISASLNDCKNLAIVYRQEAEEYVQDVCKCEPHLLPNFARDFFTHLKKQQEQRLVNNGIQPDDENRPLPALLVPDDLLTFADAAAEGGIIQPQVNCRGFDPNV